MSLVGEFRNNNNTQNGQHKVAIFLPNCTNMKLYLFLFIYSAFVILAVNTRRNIQNNPGSPNSGGSGNNYLRQTESDWQGQWFTGSCK